MYPFITKKKRILNKKKFIQNTSFGVKSIWLSIQGNPRYVTIAHSSLICAFSDNAFEELDAESICPDNPI